MTAPSQNKVVHCLNSGEVTWCGLPGPWQEESRPIEQVREFWTEAERDVFGDRTVRREGLVGRRVSWYSYQDQVAASHWSLVTCPRCLDEHQRVLEEQKREQQRYERKLTLIVVGIVAVALAISAVYGLSVR